MKLTKRQLKMIIEASFFDKMTKVRRNLERTSDISGSNLSNPEIEIGDDFESIHDQQTGLSRRDFIKAAFGTGIALGLGNMIFGDEIVLNFKENVEDISDQEFDFMWGNGITRDIVTINGKKHTILVPNPEVDRLINSYNAVLEAERLGNSNDYDNIVEQFCFRLSDYVHWKYSQIEDAGFEDEGNDIDADSYQVSGYRAEELMRALKDYYDYYGPNYD